MFLIFLLFTALETRIDSAFIFSLPDDTAKVISHALAYPDSMVKLPLYGRWINRYQNDLVVLNGDSILFYSPYTFCIDSTMNLPFSGVKRVYTDKKGRIILVKNKKSFYLNGKESKVRILPDTINVVNGRKVSYRYISPVLYGNLVFHLNERNRVVMKVPIETTAKTLMLKRYNQLPSFLAYEQGKYLVYTYDGKLYIGDTILKDGLLQGIARMRKDTIFISNLKDTDSVCVFLYPKMEYRGRIGFRNSPFSVLHSDLDGNVYFKGKWIYKDKYLVSPSMYDIDNDGNKEIILGRMDGSFAVLKKYKGRYQEYMSHVPSSDIYKRYFSIDGVPLFYMTTLKKSPFASVLDTLNPMYYDEYIYVLEHGSPEFLDSLIKVGMDFLYENIFDIYLAARRLKYVDLYELPDGRTTLILNKKDTIPPDMYYEYVVFPRILYEFPKKPLFREFFMNDRSFGRSVIEVVEKDTTVMDAVRSFYKWAKSFMHFGYMTNDLDPVVIYKKAYGSCGEHSILSAALLKAILIPAYVAVDMGEDHQWNEFYNGKRWVHFDLTQEIEKALDNPFASSEGLGHKEVSTVVGVSPTGKYFPITSHGYTKTGRIYVDVVDSMDNPVPYALVVVKSHWNGRNSVSIFKYTDENGRAFFDIGRERLGYSLDVYSPYGKGGIGNFYIDEGDTVNLLVKLPDAVAPCNRRKNAKMLVFGRNFRTGETDIMLKNGFICSKGNKIFNPILNAIGVYVKEDTLFMESRPPHLNVSIKDTVIKNGMPLVCKIDAKDNLGIKQVKAIFSGKVKRVFNLNVLNGMDTIFVNEDTVMPPGVYKVLFLAEDFSHNKSKEEKIVEIKNTSVFKDQLVKQDPIGTDKGSWNYVIQIKDTLPFIYIETDGKKEHMDIDLFLKRDKKVIKKSTSPTAHETIYLHPLLPGTYTIVVQGWHVPQNKGLFDIKVVY